MAMEMNLSETAFVFPGEECRIIRYFTPEAEMKLCGHATLSASHILYETGMVKSNEEIRFSSKAGELIIRKHGDWITMNFPVYPLEKMELTAEFERVTGSIPQELYQGRFWLDACLNEK